MLTNSLLQNLTEAENVTATQINYLQEQFWPQFSNANYPVSAVDDPRNWIKWSNVNSIDWYIIMLNQASPERFMMDYAIQDRCLSITNITCFEVVMAPIIGDITKIAMEDYLNYSKYLVNQTDFTAGFKVAFSSLWHAKLPCFDTRGISAFEEGEKGILKQCKWKGKIVPCSGIFTTFPTDRGMCCSFNMKAANEIFADSQYSSLVTQLQYEDFSTSFENSTLPDWFIKSNEPTSQPGKNMGLEIILDAHSDILESQSVNSDFEGLTGLITDSESFPMTDLRGFDIKAGHINHVAISAVQIGADDKLRTLESVTRKCLYPDEIESLKLFKTYSQANCFLECNLKFAQKQLAIEQNLTQGCTPWSFPFVNDNFKMCDPFQTEDVRYMMKNVPSEECSHCLPDCIRTMYDQKVTSQPFRRCDERNFFVTEFCTVDIGNRFEPPIWARHFIETFIKTQGKIPSYISNLQSSKRTIKVPYYYSNFFEGLSQDYEAYEKDIAVLKVFFDSTTVMLYETQPTQSWIDYFSAVGGALGLCIGLSIMTVIEIIWLCFRICGLVQNKEDSNEVKNLQ